MRKFLKDVIETFISGDWGNEISSEDMPIVVRCIRGADIDNVNQEQYQAIPSRYIALGTLKKKQLQIGDIILEKSGGSTNQSTGRTAILTKRYFDKIGNTICSNFCVGFRVKSQYNAEFIAYYLHLVYDKGVFFNFESKTTGIKNLMVDQAFSSIPIPEFDKINPNDIVKILKCIDEKIILNTDINYKLNSIITQLYYYWFVQFDFPNEEGKPYKSSGGKMVWNEKLKKEIPLGWSVDKISSLIEQNKGGDWGKDEPVGNYLQKVSCIRGADINYIKGNDSNSDLPERYILEKNSHKLLSANDIVIEISGGSPTQSTGRVAMITEKTIERFDNPLICSNFCQAITLKDANLAGYFFYMWSMFYEQNIFFNYEGKTSGIKNFLFDSFVANEWYIPSQAIAHKFQQTVNSIYKKKESLLKQNKHLTACRDWLLPLLMSGQVKVKSQIEESVLNIAAEPVAGYSKLKVKDCSSVDNAILAGYIIHKNKNKEFGRVKLVKQLYLTEQLCELDLHSNFYRNTAGPYDENLVNNAESILNRYKFYRTEKQKTRNGHTLVCYKEQSAAFEITQLFEQNFAEKKELIDSLLDKLCKLTGDMNEIIATLFAVWNNRLIRKQSISDEVLIQDFYDWSEHKHDFSEKLVLKALSFMREENIIPSGCGKYIDVAA